MRGEMTMREAGKKGGERRRQMCPDGQPAVRQNYDLYPLQIRWVDDEAGRRSCSKSAVIRDLVDQARGAQ